MNDVKDLMNSNPTQTISLSAIKKETPAVSINAINGLSGVAEEQPTEKEVIRITSNKKRPSRRSADSIQRVDPNDYISKDPEAPAKVPIISDAMADLDAMVKRKQQEYVDFVNHAIEEDAINRERVEAGLESVNGELNYLPEGVEYDTVDDEPLSMIPEEPTDDWEDDFEESEYVEPTAPAPSMVTVSNSLFDSIDSDDIGIPEEEDDIEEDEEVIEEEVSIEEEIDDKDEEVIEEDQEDIDKEIQDNITKGSISIVSKVELDSSDVIAKSTSSDFDIDEDDFEDVTRSTNNEEALTDEQIREISEASEKNLKSEILQKIIQAGKKLDTSQFVVSNKVINIKDAIKSSEKKAERTGTWPLTYAGRPFKATALKGPEIALLADSDNTENVVGISNTQARIMFEHDANPYRPATLEAWAKTIPFADVENIFAALFVASMKGANYIPMACPKDSCQYAYLTDNLNIDDMVSFDTDEAKKRFESIKSIELTPENTGNYESVVSVINDRFAIGIKIPSIFTVLYEFASLNNEFINKYSTVVSIIQYIDYIYYINPDTMQYEPIGWKTYAGDNTKTFKSKIATYSKILKELDDTDFSILIALINSMITKTSELKGITYKIPAAKCPKCGADIEEREINARGLVFMRQRLVELATTPSEK